MVIASARAKLVLFCFASAAACGSSPPTFIGSDTTAAGATAGAAGAPGGGGGQALCEVLRGPDVVATCHECDERVSEPCQPNGCYDRWWCNTDTRECHPPAQSACGSSEVPASCVQARDAIGCCASDGNAYFCKSGSAVRQSVCAAGTCGWNASRGYYACDTDGRADPSGKHPQACLVPNTP